MAEHRVASLDLLRGAAAFAVAVPHFVLLDGAGSAVAERISVLAVEVFFVLSGYVLAPQILHCLADGRPGTLGVFLVRRWMRTIPPYLLALTLIAVMAGDLLSADFLRYAFYVQNLFAQHNAADFYPVAWSLSIEEWFYVSFPVLLVAAGRASGRRDVGFAVGAALLFIAVVTVARLGLGDHADWGPAVRRVVVFRVDSIAYGFLLHVAVRRWSAGQAAGGALRWLAALLAPLTGLLAYGALAAAGGGGAAWPERAFPFAAAGFGIACILLAHAVRTPVQRHAWLAGPALFLGRISYSVYLLHLVVGLLLGPTLDGLPALVQVGLFVLLMTAVSAVFFQYFERPILAARPRYRQGPADAAVDRAGIRAAAGPV